MKTNRSIFSAAVRFASLGSFHREGVRFALLAISAFLLCACATQPKPPVVTQLPKSLPQHFEMHYLPSAYFGGRQEIILEGGYLVRRDYVAKAHGRLYRNELDRTEYFVPTEAQWQEFWAEMKRIRVWEWRRKYDATDVGGEFYEGGGWHFKLAYLGREIDTAGENAGPKPGNPKATTTGDDRQDEHLAEAVSRLLKKGD